MSLVASVDPSLITNKTKPCVSRAMASNHSLTTCSIDASSLNAGMTTRSSGGKDSRDNGDKGCLLVAGLRHRKDFRIRKGAIVKGNLIKSPDEIIAGDSLVLGSNHQRLFV